MKSMEGWKGRAARFLAAQTVSLFGSSLVQYAIVWYITLQTSSGVMMTLSTLCGYVPQVLISIFAGVWLDRHDRKRLIMLSDAVIAAATLAVAVCFVCGYRELWLLFIVLAVRSAGSGVQTPAINAFLPQIVPKEHLMKINGLNSTLSSLMIFVSPAVSGLLLSAAGIEATFLVDVVTAIAGIGVMLTVKSKHITDDVRGKKISAVQGAAEGIGWLRAHPVLLRRIGYNAAFKVLISPAAFLTPLLVSRSFGTEVWKLSISQMVFSLGAVAGGLLIASWGGLKNRWHTVLAASAFYGLMMVGIGAARGYGLYLLFNGLIGISMPGYNAPFTVMLQEETDSRVQGRIFSILQISNACALPLGTLLFGPLADWIPVQSILLVMGIAAALLPVFSWRREACRAQSV